jgi:hypothetical protein
MTYRFEITAVVFTACAALATAACQGTAPSPVSPSAVQGTDSALNADGSNLKVTAPIGIFPLFEQTNVAVTPQLSGRVSFGRNVTTASLSYRFQVSDADNFGNIVSSGTGAVDATGVVRFSVEPALATNKRYVWRFRAEMEDAVGPWSNLMAFTTTTGSGPTSPGAPSPNAGPRPADPPPGQSLPLPDMQGVLARFSDARDSCPTGQKYVNNPWQDRVIDAFRQIDSRWGYNGKPTRSAADNGTWWTCWSGTVVRRRRSRGVSSPMNPASGRERDGSEIKSSELEIKNTRACCRNAAGLFVSERKSAHACRIPPSSHEHFARVSHPGLTKLGRVAGGTHQRAEIGRGTSPAGAGSYRRAPGHRTTQDPSTR